MGGGEQEDTSEYPRKTAYGQAKIRRVQADSRRPQDDVNRQQYRAQGQQDGRPHRGSHRDQHDLPGPQASLGFDAGLDQLGQGHIQQDLLRDGFRRSQGGQGYGLGRTALGHILQHFGVVVHRCLYVGLG